MDDIPSRVAVLEQIARNTETRLAEMHADIREIRTDIRWLLAAYAGGFLILLGVMFEGHYLCAR